MCNIHTCFLHHFHTYFHYTMSNIDVVHVLFEIKKSSFQFRYPSMSSETQNEKTLFLSNNKNENKKKLNENIRLRILKGKQLYIEVKFLLRTYQSINVCKAILILK